MELSLYKKKCSFEPLPPILQPLSAGYEALQAGSEIRWLEAPSVQSLGLSAGTNALHLSFVTVMVSYGVAVQSLLGIQNSEQREPMTT